MSLRGSADKHDQVGQLARLDAPQILRKSDRLGPVHGGGAQDLERLPAAARQGPHLPVIADALHLAVAADTHMPAGPRDLGGRFGNQRKNMFILVKPR